MRFSTSELADRLGGTLIGPDVTVDGASIDSRSLVPGQLFVPIVAERDGHSFIGAAVDAGSPAYLTATAVAEVGATAVAVEDTASALLELGRMARDRIGDLGGGVVGITGSVGKTTTKDLVRACLAVAFPTAASERSYNNELGLPLTLLNAADDVRWVVLEMGARGFGHIAQLAEVARPDVGIVTSVAMAHVEYLGDLDGVARAKSELVAALPGSGVAVLNFDDPRVAAMGSQCGAPVLGYSVAGVAEAEVRAEDVTLDDALAPRFRLVTPWGEGDVRLSLAGAQQVSNALAAAAAALWCGAGFDAVVEALGSVKASALRMEVRRAGNGGSGGPALIVDCYNANPASTEAALRSLASLAADRRVALVGLMAELGAATDREHRRLAALAEELGIEVVGYETDLYGAARVDGVDAAVALLRGTGPGDAVLVKGSRVARLEDVVRAYEAGA
ncbi:MAG TPA: UDP-N-acetylmuramoyl-tripeptide--D-alanyl-D-alanine ligase [Acidimicrobiales bacterium]|nr:UDP-N-acetylmuramoyl-tripeptide--D-alanyl-D-alanine ligase [Acidimicrobiales bacterium]